MLLFTCPARLRVTVKLLTGRAAYWTSYPTPCSRTSDLRGAIFPSLAANLRTNVTRDAIDRFDWNAVWRNATILRLPETVFRLTLVAAATVSAVFVLSSVLA